MSITVRPRVMESSTMRPEREGLNGPTGEIWRVTGLYGFHPSKDKIENERIWREFQGWFGVFVADQKLWIHREAPLPVRTVSDALYPRKKRSPVDRVELVPIDKINELVLVWGLVLLKFGYRGLSMHAGLSALKREVVWLLEQFQYDLPGARSIFDPGQNDWRRHATHWCAVRDYNAGEKLSLPVPGPAAR